MITCSTISSTSLITWDHASYNLHNLLDSRRFSSRFSEVITCFTISSSSVITWDHASHKICCIQWSIFLELKKVDIWNNTQLWSASILPPASFSILSVFLDIAMIWSNVFHFNVLESHLVDTSSYSLTSSNSCIVYNHLACWHKF